MKGLKKVSALLMVAMLLIGMMPMSALAQDKEQARKEKAAVSSKTIEKEEDDTSEFTMSDSSERKNYSFYGWWRRDNYGWWFQLSTGGYLRNQHVTINGEEYFFNLQGYMVTGWNYENGDWYYYDASGAMHRGWLWNNGAWYFMYNDGTMVLGWEKLGGIWYYFNGSGVMVTGWQVIDGDWFYFNGSGAQQFGWLLYGGAWYYLDPYGDYGDMVTGWQIIGGVQYYFYGSGAMATGWQPISGKWYYFNSGGAMVRNQWVGNYYLLDSGVMATNQWIGNYYVGPDGLWIPNYAGPQQPQEPSGPDYAANLQALKQYILTYGNSDYYYRYLNMTDYVEENQYSFSILYDHDADVLDFMLSDQGSGSASSLVMTVKTVGENAYVWYSFEVDGYGTVAEGTTTVNPNTYDGQSKIYFTPETLNAGLTSSHLQDLGNVFLQMGFVGWDIMLSNANLSMNALGFVAYTE